MKTESSILHRHGRMTAEEESRETKQEQEEGRHRPRFLDYRVMKVKPLSADRILASHRRDLATARSRRSRLGILLRATGPLRFGVKRVGSEALSSVNHPMRFPEILI